LNILVLMKSSGINLSELLKSIRGIPFFIRNYFNFIKTYNKKNNEFPIRVFYPCLKDRFEKAGNLPGHYFFQDLIVANKIFLNNPETHVDIGSRIDGFVAHVAGFRNIKIFDIRDFPVSIPNVEFIRADLMDRDFVFENFCDSVSSLHAIEHFGLGRYGDNVDYDGHLKGLENIYKLLKPGGIFYLSVPIGPQRIEFDAHRVFSIRYLHDWFKDKFQLESFSYIDDKNNYFINLNLDEEKIGNNCQCNFGCGIFELKKL
jgi:SAM-dependent methyltransferase